jgi:sterol desaturase/sphingolipid hydroxylase (fatty acid hydroxylase superfamily)
MKLIFWVVFGPTPLISLVGSVYIFSYLYDISDDTDLNRKFNSDISPLKSFVEFMLLQIVGDFFLYWGHRIQHEIPSLWEHHKLHHTLETPSPLGTLYIDSLDASLQGAIPILLAIAIVRPHLLMVYVYIFCRISENVLNHSGLDSVLVDTLTLKVLPGRASIAHHDSHHKFSNYPKGAKNYGENFIFWDYLFGTLRKNNLNID